MVPGALEVSNDAFHDIYGAAQREVVRAGPVFVLVGDELVVFRRGARVVHSLRQPLFETIKAVAHLAVAAVVARRVSGSERVESLKAFVTGARAGLDVPDGAIRKDLDDVLRSTAELLAADVPDSRIRALGKMLLRLTEHATRIELAALHRAVDEALAPLEDGEKGALEVVVVGDHQARRRSLGMQYFCKRLGDSPDAEARVIYGEAIAGEGEALALVGTRRVDRAIASLLFDDGKRLQRDVLGDAAAAELNHFPLPRVG